MYIREAVAVRVKGKFINMTRVILILHQLSNVLVLVPTYKLTFIFTAESVDCTTVLTALITMHICIIRATKKVSRN